MSATRPLDLDALEAALDEHGETAWLVGFTSDDPVTKQHAVIAADGTVLLATGSDTAAMWLAYRIVMLSNHAPALIAALREARARVVELEGDLKLLTQDHTQRTAETLSAEIEAREACQERDAAQAEVERLKATAGQLHADLYGMQDGSLLRDTRAEVERLTKERDSEIATADSLRAVAQEQSAEVARLQRENRDLRYPPESPAPTTQERTAEETRLYALIARAPHDLRCIGRKEGPLDCDCWKAEALR